MSDAMTLFWTLFIGMQIGSCVDGAMLRHDRKNMTGEFAGCVCAPKETK